MDQLGTETWVIPEGYIPGRGIDDEALASHEAFCVLNAGDAEAHLRITLYFADREPVGPYRRDGRGTSAPTISSSRRCRGTPTMRR